MSRFTAYGAGFAVYYSTISCADVYSFLDVAAIKAMMAEMYVTFRKFRVPYFGVLVIRILLFRVLYWGPLFSETPI